MVTQNRQNNDLYDKWYLNEGRKNAFCNTFDMLVLKTNFRSFFRVPFFTEVTFLIADIFALLHNCEDEINITLNHFLNEY